MINLLNTFLDKTILREFVKNSLPNLAILLPLLCVKLLLNNSLFLKQFILIKEIIIANLGTLFFTNSLTEKKRGHSKIIFPARAMSYKLEPSFPSNQNLDK